MGSVARQDRDRALKAVAFWCASQFQGIEPGDQVLEELGFGSVDAMQRQLVNWGLPDWITQPETAADKPKPSKPAAPERQARNSGPTRELPTAGDAAPLFQERLEVLGRATDELKHRKEKLQGKRFVQSSVYANSVHFFRKEFTHEQWKNLSEHYGFDLDSDRFSTSDVRTWSLGGGTPAPQAPLPALIGAYLLAGGEVAPLLETLYPGEPSAEVEEKIRKRVEGRKGTDKQDGLQVLAQQLATLIRGGEVGKGRDPAELSNHEINLACRITECRDANVPDEQIYEELLSGVRLSKENFPWDEFRRLAALQQRWPWT